ncbi:glutathione S-transferase [Marinicauda algicola]|uniref:Glutathione S-transferase n=1 Tax=Marinicauda algicola TaxID=2029849 RepID=A0A4S2GYE0_9PROT|nr:glutathione S-transferase [Marinicauda algicola]TGY88240.1 glutathione S-transferase [Marinicauda algicola]
MDETLTLYGERGWGSAIVEAQLEWYGLPYRFEPVGDLFRDAAARRRLEAVNPLGQVPALQIGTRVMTESAAITLHLAERVNSDGLVPGPDTPERADFLRWLVFIVANIYPTYTYGDDPARFVDLEEARKPFRARTDAYAKRLYTVLDSAAGSPFFLGRRMSAIDIYIAVMTHWRPGRAWFETETVRLAGIARRIGEDARLGPVIARNFPA